MNLEIFNNLINNTKENDLVQKFIKELSEFLENANNKISNKTIEVNDNRQENCLYQVVEMGTNYAYLQNTNNNKIFQEQNIPKEVLDKIGNDTILRYKDGKYVIEEELTQKFYESLIGIKEYETIKDNFINESNILEIDSNTKYKIQEKEKDYCILNYENEEKNMLKVPNALIPFWANVGENLYYKNGKFNRDM